MILEILVKWNTIEKMANDEKQNWTFCKQKTSELESIRVKLDNIERFLGTLGVYDSLESLNRDLERLDVIDYIFKS